MNERLHPYQRRFYIVALQLLVILVRSLKGNLDDHVNRKVDEAIRLQREMWPGMEDDK